MCGAVIPSDRDWAVIICRHQNSKSRDIVASGKQSTYGMMCSLPPSKHMFLGCGLKGKENPVQSTQCNPASLDLETMENVIVCSEFDLDELFDIPRTAAQDTNRDSKRV